MKKKSNSSFTRIVVFMWFLQLIVFFFQYRVLDYWFWLGCPSPSEIILAESDCYPGHGIDCIKYRDFMHEWQRGTGKYVYDDIGEGVDIAGINIHIGDTKRHVRHELRYGDFCKGEYNMWCCMCCATFCRFQFEYDENNDLIRMTIEYNFLG